MKTKADLEAAANQAQWSACYELRYLSETGQSGFDWTHLVKAMFHAGEAWAYYQSRDAVVAAMDRADKKTSK